MHPVIVALMTVVVPLNPKDFSIIVIIDNSLLLEVRGQLVQTDPISGRRTFKGPSGTGATTPGGIKQVWFLPGAGQVFLIRTGSGDLLWGRWVGEIVRHPGKKVMEQSQAPLRVACACTQSWPLRFVGCRAL
jgi:hypothetical protein